MNQRWRRLPRVREAAALTLTFEPLAWLKWMQFCHAGPTEVGGFGVCSKRDPLRIVRFESVPQRCTPASVELEDVGVAEWIDRATDEGLSPPQCLRVWLHTHPDGGALPTATDESTFARVFGHGDWAVMAIVSRSGDAFARLRMTVDGIGVAMPLAVDVDWSAWAAVDATALAEQVASWQQEFAANVADVSLPLFSELDSVDALNVQALEWPDGDGDAMGDSAIDTNALDVDEVPA